MDLPEVVQKFWADMVEYIKSRTQAMRIVEWVKSALHLTDENASEQQAPTGSPPPSAPPPPSSQTGLESVNPVAQLFNAENKPDDGHKKVAHLEAHKQSKNAPGIKIA